MTTSTFERQDAGLSPISFAAWAMIAGAVLQVVLGIALAPLQARVPPPWPIPALNALSHLLLSAGVVGVVRSGAAGRGRLAAAGLGLTLLGLAVLTAAEVIWATAGEDASAPFYGVGTLSLMVGLVLAGIAVLRAGRWSGWRRFIILITGLFIPLILLPAFALPGHAANYALGLWGVCWLSIGLALRADAGDVVTP